jgi:hypothetical protein
VFSYRVLTYRTCFADAQLLPQDGNGIPMTSVGELLIEVLHLLRRLSPGRFRSFDSRFSASVLVFFCSQTTFRGLHFPRACHDNLAQTPDLAGFVSIRV